jgi:hypothetical protein
MLPDSLTCRGVESVNDLFIAFPVKHDGLPIRDGHGRKPPTDFTLPNDLRPIRRPGVGKSLVLCRVAVSLRAKNLRPIAGAGVTANREASHNPESGHNFEDVANRCQFA